MRITHKLVSMFLCVGNNLINRRSMINILPGYRILNYSHPAPFRTSLLAPQSSALTQSHGLFSRPCPALAFRFMPGFMLGASAARRILGSLPRCCAISVMNLTKGFSSATPGG